MNATFTCGLKEEKISFEILNKELSLDNTLKNIKKSIRIINKNMKKDNNQLNDIIKEIKNDIYAKMKKDFDALKEQTYNLKLEFKKDLLEKVYPIGSYYRSKNNTSPEKLFGGKWESIYGKFIFSTDSNHSVDSTGGEEKHKLTINEMPSHNHGYNEFNYYSYYIFNSLPGTGNYLPVRNDSNFICSHKTNYEGNSEAHNNMPPYITAYCWRRYQ